MNLRAAAAVVAIAAVAAHPAVDVAFALLAALARPHPHCLYFALYSVAAVVTGCSD